MSKLYTATLAVLLVAFNAAGQITPTYYFTHTTAPYNNLVGAASATENNVWDDPIIVIPIGFTFELLGQPLDSLYFAYGYGTAVSSYVDEFFETELIIEPFEADVIDRGYLTGVSQSSINYVLDGLVGNRILKVEWNNVGFYEEYAANNTFNQFANFQLWLYEGTNTIEMRYGTNNITDIDLIFDGESGPAVGIEDWGWDNVYRLTGNPANPTLVDTMAYLAGIPASGTVYRFTTSLPTHAAHPERVLSGVFPNPFSDRTVVRFASQVPEGASLHLTDGYGRTVRTWDNLAAQQVEITRGDLVPGIYFYHLMAGNRNLATGKLAVE